MTRPSAAYLRQLIRHLTADATTPLTIRNECQNLMLAINANDLTEITERLAYLLRLADREGLSLPRPKTEPSRPD